MSSVRNYLAMGAGLLLGAPGLLFGSTNIHVTVPTTDTQLYFDDTLTKQTGTDRLFSYDSEELDPAKTYHYDVKALVENEDGDEMEKDLQVNFHPGDIVNVTFTMQKGEDGDLLEGTYTDQTPAIQPAVPVTTTPVYSGYAAYSGYSSYPYYSGYSYPYYGYGYGYYPYYGYYSSYYPRYYGGRYYGGYRGGYYGGGYRGGYYGGYRGGVYRGGGFHGGGFHGGGFHGGGGHHR